MSHKALRKRLRKIEERILPKPEDDLILVWSFGPKDKPHGKYGYCKYHIDTGEMEACTEEEEIEFLQQAYHRIPPKARKRVEYWSSFQKFKEHNRCKCGRPHTDAEKSKQFEGLHQKAIIAISNNLLRKYKRELRSRLREKYPEIVDEIDF